MRQARLLLNEINRKKDALSRTKSKYLIRDYTKSIKADMEDLKEYCKYRNIDFNRLVNED